MRDFQTFCARCAGAALAVCLMAQSAPIHAQSSSQPAEPIRNVDAPRGAASFDRGLAAWGRGDFDVAEAQLKDALDQGGLARKDVLKAHVYLGSARAVLGKSDGAVAAFRIAATLDPSFNVPAEAGKKTARIADGARKQRLRQVAIHGQAPAEVPEDRPFRVDVSVDTTPASGKSHKSGAHDVLPVTRVSLHVSDGAPGSGYKAEQATAARVSFEVPARIATADSYLFVRISGTDGRGNEFVTREVQVHVQGEKVPGPTPVEYPAAAPAARKTGSEPARSLVLADANRNRKRIEADRDSSKGGFWSSPWPYIIGGAVLAGAGAGAYFVLRPPEQVTVTQVQVQGVQ